MLLAGDVDGAIPHLADALHACVSIDLGLLLRIRAAADLGQALESKGDKSGACDAYGFVLTRWGDAKPRSTTADIARTHAKKLGCPAIASSGR
jgi:hypothetical protein